MTSRLDKACTGMKTGLLKITFALVTASLVAGCDTSEGVGQLFAQSSSNAGPDEFGILPTKPLDMPKDLTNLPEPDLGGPNLVDPKPFHDAVAAMGGRPEQLDSTRSNGGEGPLLAAATRFGTAANIREVTAAEDEEFRANNQPRLLERWFGTNTYFRRYESQTLQARRELERFRRYGARTPTVPPVDER